MSRVAVVGGGTMGNGIAQVFATKGHDVVLLEVNSGRIDKAKQAIQGSLERIAKKGGLTPEEAKDLAVRAVQFKKERGRVPALDSQDAWECRMAEGAAAFMRYKKEGRYE